MPVWTALSWIFGIGGFLLAYVFWPNIGPALLAWTVPAAMLLVGWLAKSP